MNENQKIVYDWLVSTCRIESIGVAYAFQELTEPDVEALQNFYKLTPIEKDEVLYQAIVEVDGEKHFRRQKNGAAKCHTNQKYTNKL